MKNLLLTSLLLFSVTGFGQCPTDIIYLTTQVEVDNFGTNYPGCTILEVPISISGSDITNLAGLSHLVSTSSGIYIENNPSLLTAHELDLVVTSTTDSGVIHLRDNPLLTTLPIFTQGTPQFYYVNVQNNPGLNNLNGFLGLTSVEHIIIWNCDSLINLAGLDNITYSNFHYLAIKNNDALQSISELSNFSGDMVILRIEGNPQLVNLHGLEGIVNILFVTAILNNDTLLNLDGLQNIRGGNEFQIKDNNALQSFEGLDSAIIFQDIEIENNPALVDISNFETNHANAIDDLRIIGNTNLETCHISNICTYLENNGVSTIQNNAPGCNTIQEVRTLCDLSIAEVVLEREVLIFPNPVSETLQISASDGISVEGATIYSILGENLITTYENTVDVSYLSKEIYFIEIVTNKGIITKKILKE